MRKIVYLLPFVAFVLFSCQKEIDPGVLGTTTGGGTTGGSGGTGGTGGTSASYHPTTLGSNWKYQDSASGAFSTEKIISRTAVYGGITYTGMQAVNTSLTDTIYVASPQPEYYYHEAGTSPNTGASVDLLFRYLNDTASVGYTWNYTAGQGNGFTAYFKGTIMERNLTVTIGSKTFTNVIHTNMILTYDLGSGFTLDAASYDFYVAKGVGIIRVRTFSGAFGFGTTICNNLVDYHIQ